MAVIKRVVLTQKRECSKCGRAMEAGTVAVKDRKHPTVYFHTDCKEATK